MKAASDRKIVIAIASSALFDLTESDRIFEEQGIEKYKKFQEKNVHVKLEKGVAFPFISRFLKLNEAFPKERPAEVVLLSRNSPETGLRVFNSIEQYGLDISKAGFFSGESPYRYIPAFQASLFLSANQQDVRNAIKLNYPAGRVINTKVDDDETVNELRIAFDFDGVIADDSSENAYRNKGLEKYQKIETQKSGIPLNPGPLRNFLTQITYFRNLELEKVEKNKKYERKLRIAVVTARSAPAHERAIKTLKAWGISVDEAFFLGKTKKKQILEVMKPHIYFDDQESHFKDIHKIPLVHIPFGQLNEVP